jgi:hypothetical protein
MYCGGDACRVAAAAAAAGDKAFMATVMATVTEARLMAGLGEVAEARRLFADFVAEFPQAAGHAVVWIAWARVEEDAHNLIEAVDVLTRGAQACRPNEAEHGLVVAALSRTAQAITSKPSVLKSVKKAVRGEAADGAPDAASSARSGGVGAATPQRVHHSSIARTPASAGKASTPSSAPIAAAASAGGLSLTELDGGDDASVAAPPARLRTPIVATGSESAPPLTPPSPVFAALIAGGIPTPFQSRSGGAPAGAPGSPDSRDSASIVGLPTSPATFTALPARSSSGGAAAASALSPLSPRLAQAPPSPSAAPSLPPAAAAAPAFSPLVAAASPRFTGRVGRVMPLRAGGFVSPPPLPATDAPVAVGDAAPAAVGGDAAAAGTPVVTSPIHSLLAPGDSMESPGAALHRAQRMSPQEAAAKERARLVADPAMAAGRKSGGGSGGGGGGGRKSMTAARSVAGKRTGSRDAAEVGRPSLAPLGSAYLLKVVKARPADAARLGAGKYLTPVRRSIRAVIQETVRTGLAPPAASAVSVAASGVKTGAASAVRSTAAISTGLDDSVVVEEAQANPATPAAPSTPFTPSYFATPMTSVRPAAPVSALRSGGARRVPLAASSDPVAPSGATTTTPAGAPAPAATPAAGAAMVTPHTAAATRTGGRSAAATARRTSARRFVTPPGSVDTGLGGTGFGGGLTFAEARQAAASATKRALAAALGVPGTSPLAAGGLTPGGKAAAGGAAPAGKPLDVSDAIAAAVAAALRSDSLADAEYAWVPNPAIPDDVLPPMA